MIHFIFELLSGEYCQKYRILCGCKCSEMSVTIFEFDRTFLSFQNVFSVSNNTEKLFLDINEIN